MSNNTSLSFEPKPEDARAKAYFLLETADMHKGDLPMKVTIENNGDIHVEGSFRLGPVDPMIAKGAARITNLKRPLLR